MQYPLDLTTTPTSTPTITPTPTSTPTTTPIYNFPDPVLESVIRDTINKPFGDIYQEDLDGLTEIIADDKDKKYSLTKKGQEKLLKHLKTFFSTFCDLDEMRDCCK